MEVLYSSNNLYSRKHFDYKAHANGVIADLDFDVRRSGAIFSTDEFIYIKTDDGLKMMIEYGVGNTTELADYYYLSGNIETLSITTNRLIKNQKEIIKKIVKFIQKAVCHDTNYHDYNGNRDERVWCDPTFEFPYKSPKENNIKYLRID